MFGRISNIGVRNLCKFDLNGLSHRSVNIKMNHFSDTFSYLTMWRCWFLSWPQFDNCMIKSWSMQLFLNHLWFRTAKSRVNSVESSRFNVFLPAGATLPSLKYLGWISNFLLRNLKKAGKRLVNALRKAGLNWQGNKQLRLERKKKRGYDGHIPFLCVV